MEASFDAASELRPRLSTLHLIVVGLLDQELRMNETNDGRFRMVVTRTKLVKALMFPCNSKIDSSTGAIRLPESVPEEKAAIATGTIAFAVLPFGLKRWSPARV
jgi:hypothetical protein